MVARRNSFEMAAVRFEVVEVMMMNIFGNDYIHMHIDNVVSRYHLVLSLMETE